MLDNSLYINQSEVWMITFTLILLSMSEGMNYRVRDNYEDKFGVDSWRPVYINSLIIGAMSGVITVIGSNILSTGQITLYLANFGTIVGYIGMQSIYTDLSIKQVDRWVLRIGYLDVFVITLIYMFSMFSGNALRAASMPIIGLYFGLAIIFLFNAIGSSDVRTFAIILPFMLVVNIPVGIISFIIVIAIAAIAMFIKKVKAKDPLLKIPIIPYLIVPYIFLMPFMELLLETYRASYFK